MIKKIPLVLLSAAIIIYGCGNKGKSAQESVKTQAAITVDEAADSLGRVLDGDLTPAQRLPLIVKFLNDYPQSKYTTDLIGDAVYYQGTDLGDTAGAIAFAEKIRAKITDPAMALEFDKDMVDFYGNARMIEKMVSLSDRLHSAGALKFKDYFDIAQHAADAGNWAVARDFCARAGGLANAETYRADYPDEKFTDEQIETAGNNRAGMILILDSWARANLGEVNEALAGFSDAKRLIRHSYLNIPERDLDRYWGKVMMMKGDFKGAMDIFAPDALIMRDEDSMAGFREAYVRLHSDEAGYEAFAMEMRKKIARKIDDFELPDFRGGRKTYSTLKGDVTLVAFWSPT